ncbi:Uncharacterized protein OBRU01_21620 [Operophtera brumata]|uniref:Ig-like domain-containing protein n=1 Tax=Operophtera brumata TaxID=104452 RepID=A0A0L7KT22_OPEBR|nr:Uncharacterized protein OBRU01_21620 [Operophtera brumata]
MIVGAAVNEPTRITCEVDAFPKPKEGEWQWTVNNSVGTVEVRQSINLHSDYQLHSKINVLSQCTKNLVLYKTKQDNSSV